MKLIRFLAEDDTICFGAVDDEKVATARVIEGSVLAPRIRSGREVKVKRLLAPIEPPNIIALGLNYRKHADETGIKYPSRPVLFLKATTSLAGPGDAIILPKAGPNEVDYEGELAVVIGKKARNVPLEEAKEYILGYSVANDVSARDWQLKLQKGQWCRGKSFDTFCPVGPWIVTRDEISDPGNLRIVTRINDQVFQDSTTADMIFPIPAIVSQLSQSMTLLPGTLILTGTPEGVGFTRRPPVFLKTGDRVSVTIAQVGTLTNPVILEA